METGVDLTEAVSRYRHARKHDRPRPPASLHPLHERDEPDVR
jgi:hypothetical protein